MTKNIEIDALDREIILTLENQGYIKSTVISKKLGSNPRTIRRRMERLKNLGLFRVVGLTNPIALGYRAWARICIQADPNLLDQIVKSLIDHHSVQFVTLVSGRYNIIIAAQFQSMHQLTYFVNAELSAIEGINNFEVFLLMWPRKFYHFVWSPYTKIFESGENHGKFNNYHPYKLTEIDSKLLEILKHDGLATLPMLKDKLGLGESTIRLHLRKLSSAGVYKPSVWVNPEIHGYLFTATIGIVINNDAAQELLSELIENTDVLVASSCLGRFNIIITARFPNIDSYNDFINVKLVSKKGVKYIESFPHTKLLKSYIEM